MNSNDSRKTDVGNTVLLQLTAGTSPDSSSFNLNEANLLRGDSAEPVSVQMLQICPIGKISVIQAIQVGSVLEKTTDLEKKKKYLTAYLLKKNGV